MPRRPTVQWRALEVVADRKRVHAYEIKRILAQVAPHSSVYTALAALLAKGYVTAEWVLPEAEDQVPTGPPKKYFQMTALGIGALAAHQEAVSMRASGTRLTPGTASP